MAGHSHSHTAGVMSTKKRLLLSREELAELLEVTPRTIDNWLARGRLPKPRFDSPPKWFVTTIEQWLSEDGKHDLGDYFADYTKTTKPKAIRSNPRPRDRGNSTLGVTTTDAGQ